MQHVADGAHATRGQAVLDLQPHRLALAPDPAVVLGQVGQAGRQLERELAELVEQVMAMLQHALGVLAQRLHLLHDIGRRPFDGQATRLRIEPRDQLPVGAVLRRQRLLQRMGHRDAHAAPVERRPDRRRRRRLGRGDVERHRQRIAGRRRLRRRRLLLEMHLRAGRIPFPARDELGQALLQAARIGPARVEDALDADLAARHGPVLSAAFDAANDALDQHRQRVGGGARRRLHRALGLVPQAFGHRPAELGARVGGLGVEGARGDRLDDALRALRQHARAPRIAGLEPVGTGVVLGRRLEALGGEPAQRALGQLRRRQLAGGLGHGGLRALHHRSARRTRHAGADDARRLRRVAVARLADPRRLARQHRLLQPVLDVVGGTDGWQDLNQHNRMTWSHSRAENGNVALTGEVDLQNAHGDFLLALGFGANSFEAGQRALASLLDGFESARSTYIREWQNWLKTLRPLNSKTNGKDTQELYMVSAAVMRTHESKRFPGALIASLSIPWGFSKGDNDLGGYHLSWPRDLVESAGGLLAAGAHADARRVLYYLQVTQEADGHWPQNMWLDGSPYWGGIQMDETAFPVLLVDLARREKALKTNDLKRFWPMVKNAAGFLVKNGPVTSQDRWEEDPGYSPFTLAAEISALLAAADLADLNEEAAMGTYLRETADTWNASIERWIYATGTDLARQIGVDGYYVRISPPDVADAASPSKGFVPIKNRPPGEKAEQAAHIVSPDALALVRFGLRSPDDVRILNTVKVIDALLKTDLPYGPGWHRYNDDGYGEHQRWKPF